MTVGLPLPENGRLIAEPCTAVRIWVHLAWRAASSLIVSTSLMLASSAVRASCSVGVVLGIAA